jgi:hypothetical protein
VTFSESQYGQHLAISSARRSKMAAVRNLRRTELLCEEREERLGVGRGDRLGPSPPRPHKPSCRASARAGAYNFIPIPTGTRFGRLEGLNRLDRVNGQAQTDLLQIHRFRDNPVWGLTERDWILKEPEEPKTLLAPPVEKTAEVHSVRTPRRKKT